MASVRELARAAHVSIATVSRVLNDHPEVSPDTRKVVLDAARKTGYRRPMSSRRLSGNLALVFTAEVYWSQYDALLMNGILRAAGQRKLDVLVIDLPNSIRPGESYTRFFRRKHTAAAILRSSPRSRHICESIAEEGFPCLVIADRYENPKVNFLSYHSGDDSERAVTHLIHLHHRRIALVTTREPDRDHLDRAEGYRRAMERAGLPIPEELIVSIQPDLEGGASAINLLMSLPQPPTAAFFTDPPATVGALRRALELGLRVPGDLSIVGFDDAVERRRVFPVLTAVCQDARQIGFEAGQWLCRLLDGEVTAPLHAVKSTMFEINQSTGAPPIRPIRVLPDGTRLDASDESRTGINN